MPVPGVPGSSGGKESACNAGEPSSIPGSGDPLEKGQATHSSILGLPWWLRWWRNHPQCGRPGFDPRVRKIPWRREWQPTPVFLTGESLGQRTLAGCSSWGHRELDRPERPSTTQLIASFPSIPPPQLFSPVWSLWVCFSFVSKFICITFLDSARKWHHITLVFRDEKFWKTRSVFRDQ